MHSSDQKPLISRYRLKTRGFLNSVSNRREFEGALIQVDGGYGCIHPWPELGDPPLDKCLADLQGAQRWPIVKRALRCAQYDREARKFEHSLFEDMEEIPESHATLAKGDAKEIEAAVAAGFGTVKLKFGRQLEAEGEFLNAMAVEHPKLKWRLDFNESQSPQAIAGFLKGLRGNALRAIDFIEDPSPYSDSAWKKLYGEFRVPLAVDREAAPLSAGAQVMVIKPAVDEPFLLAEAALKHQQRVVLTSYMDHPVGQVFAVWEAARLGLQFPGLPGLCGLQTHHLFEPNEFTEVLGDWSPKFRVPNGLGLGFDDLLDSLPWSRLY